jgi:thiosulfate/3-mercaptopyruvate sulfurtransferase
MTGRRNPPLIDVEELAELRAADATLVIFDVQWVLGRSDGVELFLAAHLPGARYVDLDRDLASGPSSDLGRHPLPSHDAFQSTLRALGVTAQSTIVAYDQSHGFSASRLWWLLRHAGLDARVLDGGLRAWRDAGQPTETGAAGAVSSSALEIGWGRGSTVTIEQAANFASSGVLLDARAEERYRGDIEPLDPRAGHIPGAVSAPTTGNLNPDGSFLGAEQLRERFAALGVDDATAVASYCGSGITAAHQLLALEVAGVHGALFAGSWSQWSHDAGRPVAVGAAPR